jgi:hypothetical protein
LTSSAPQRLQQKLDSNIHENSAPDPPILAPLEVPVNNEETTIHDAHEDIPLPLNHDYEQNELIQQEQAKYRLKQRRHTIYFCVVLIVLIILITVPTTIIMLRKQSESTVKDVSNVLCTLDRQKLIQCASGSLEIPSCAKVAFDELTKVLLYENITFNFYPCDAKHFGLLAVAVAKVNANNDQIENIFQFWILAIIYFALGGQDWRQDHQWLTGKSFCDEGWFGISCLEDGSVGSIKLFSNKLVGTIPTEVALLSSLRHLQLSSNDISGTLPSEIGNLRNLSEIELNDIRMSGTLPSEIGMCQSLEYLDLYQVHLTGTIPTEIGRLSMLSEFVC